MIWPCSASMRVQLNPPPARIVLATAGLLYLVLSAGLSLLWPMSTHVSQKPIPGCLEVKAFLRYALPCIVSVGMGRMGR